MFTYKMLSHFRRYCVNLNLSLSCKDVLRLSSSLSLNESNGKSQVSTFNESRRKLLKIAIIGVPNSGKSTLINQLVDRRVFAMSKKVHTTRCRARAVHVEDDTQLVFLDTPGVVSVDEFNKFNLEQEFLDDGEEAISEAKVIGVVHDVSNSYTRNKLNPKILRLLHLYKEKESFLVLNKIDTIKSKRTLLDLSTGLTGGKLRSYGERMERSPLSEKDIKEITSKQTCWQHFSDVFMISALLGQGTTDLKNYLLGAAKADDWPYEPTTFTDQSEVKIIEDAVKSKLLEYLPQEIPYGLTVELEYLDTDNPEFMRAVVLIYCKTEKIQKLVLGAGGGRIKLIAKETEQALADTYFKEVFLKLVVSTKNPSRKSMSG